MTTAPTQLPTISRELLEDRYNGLLVLTREPLDPSKLQERFDRVIQDLIAGVSRVNWTGALDGHGDGTGSIADEVETAIREAVIRGIDRRGLAR